MWILEELSVKYLHRERVDKTIFVVITWKRATSILQDISFVSLGTKNHAGLGGDESKS